MSAADLVCVGESFEDLIFAGLDRLPRLGEEMRTASFHRTFGGGATITAVAAARLGVSARIMSALSDGAVARLRQEGVRVTNLKRRGERHAITAALSTAGDRAFVTYDGVNSELGPRIVDALSRLQARAVHCPFCPRDIPPLVQAFRGLRARGIVVSIDFGYDLDLARDPGLPGLLGEVDFVFVNEDESKLYARKKSPAAVRAFFKERARNTVIKLGPRGSCWVARDFVLEEKAPRVRAIDTTGAGDAFNAGFLAGVLSGLSATRTLRLGNAVGARSTRAVGGLEGLPRLEEL